MSFRVDQPVYSGPMDLLLHLIREHEVDVHEIAIAAILDDYLQHLGVLQALDLGDIGEFLVMASTLMEIKSRELLPREEVSIEEEFDPRDDLIRQLLEYKRYRDLSRRLDRMAQRRNRQLNPWVPLTPAAAAREASDEAEGVDLGDVDVWSLTAAFAKLLEDTGQDLTLHFGVERKDIRYYAGRLLEATKDKGEIRFETLFDKSEGRMGLIGTFTAMLELMKQGFLRAHQAECLGAILVVYVGDTHASIEDLLPPEVNVLPPEVNRPPEVNIVEPVAPDHN